MGGAALNLIHKAPAPIITGCQSAIIEHDGCGNGLFFQVIGHQVRRDILGNQSLDELKGASNAPKSIYRSG